MEEGRKSPEFANLFRQKYGDTLTLQQVVELGRQVEALTRQPGWQVLEELLGDLREKRMGDLMAPEKPLEQADYSYRIGVLKGTESVLWAAETVVTVAEEVRRDLERQAEHQLAGSG